LNKFIKSSKEWLYFLQRLHLLSNDPVIFRINQRINIKGVFLLICIQQLNLTNVASGHTLDIIAH